MNTALSAGPIRQRMCPSARRACKSYATSTLAMVLHCSRTVSPDAQNCSSARRAQCSGWRSCALNGCPSWLYCSKRLGHFFLFRCVINKNKFTMWRGKLARITYKRQRAVRTIWLRYRRYKLRAYIVNVCKAFRWRSASKLFEIMGYFGMVFSIDQNNFPSVIFLFRSFKNFFL